MTEPLPRRLLATARAVVRGLPARAAATRHWWVPPLLWWGLVAAVPVRRALPSLLTWVERDEAWRVATAVAAGSLGVGVLLAWALGTTWRRAGVGGRRALAVVVGLLAGWFAWRSTSGRWASAQPWRWPAVATVSALAGVAMLQAPGVWRRCRQRGAVCFVLSVVVVAGLLVLDARWLPTLYPLQHVALRILATLLFGLGWLARRQAGEPAAGEPAAGARGDLDWRFAGLGVALALLGGLGTPWATSSASANVRWVLGERHGLLGWAVTIASRSAAPSSPSAEALDGSAAPIDGGFVQARGEAARHRLELTERSLLLITVDALRADVLGAYGGPPGLTPHMDRLAAEGVRFERAYTPAPHTSYAVASLLCGTYAREALALQGEKGRFGHETLADVLRRYGVRTAAFYPPAVFFVDGDRFAPLRERGFGFDYRKEMFASAAERVEQLRAYLSDPSLEDRPLFVWVHLFEPHEPYEPPPGYARGAGDRDRYEGEVRYVDEAVGRLVRLFRAARPGATVVLSSDHGEAFGEHGARFHGSSLHEEQARVPLIWSTPGLLEPHRVEAAVDLPDVAPTWLAALGLPPGPRMMGDDLLPLLLGAGTDGPLHAFGSVEDERMAVEGHFKLLCRGGASTCRLFDLQRDPAERLDATSAAGAVASRLRSALAAWLAAVPRVEAAAVQAGVGWPEPLARAQLGDRSVLERLPPLLEDDRPGVRAATARVLGEMGHDAAHDHLARLAADDPSEEVRREAWIALGLLDEPTAREPLAELLRDEALAGSLRRRVALALGRLGDRQAAGALRDLALDRRAPEQLRRRALALLGRLRDHQVVEALAERLFDETEVRLRAAMAEALGAIGDRRAVTALRRRLQDEPYEDAREAEARALERLTRPRR